MDSVFNERFVRNQNRIYRYICSILPRLAEAEEIFQQTALTLLESRDRYDPNLDFVAWACGIAHNLVRSHLRRSRKAAILLSEDVMDQLGRRRLEREDALEERRRALASCLSELPERPRRVLEGVYGERRPIKDIATTEDQSPNAISKMLRRIRAALHECVSRKVAPGGAP